MERFYVCVRVVRLHKRVSVHECMSSLKAVSLGDQFSLAVVGSGSSKHLAP